MMSIMAHDGAQPRLLMLATTTLNLITTTLGLLLRMVILLLILLLLLPEQCSITHYKIGASRDATVA